MYEGVLIERHVTVPPSPPPQLRRLWSMYEGVLIERHVTEDDKMPTLFSLLHPLDDIAPLITRIGEWGGTGLAWYFSVGESVGYVFCSLLDRSNIE